MSKENKNTEGSKVSPKPLDLNDVEMVFGTPEAPKKEAVPDVRVDIANEKKQGNGNSHPKQSSESDVDAQPTQPLLEPDRGRQKPPLAGPEVDDLEADKPADATPYPGIDDGLLEDGTKKPTGGEHSPHEGSEGHPELHPGGNGIGEGEGDGNWPLTKHDQHDHGTDETDFYYDGYIGNGLHNRLGEDRPGSPMMPGVGLESIPDVNTYQQKKNLAQGMMDLALLSANANQLRYVLESSMSHPYFYPSLVFITCSIILQVAVGVGLIMNSRYNVKDEKDICKADKINNMTVLGVFLITIVNVFITSFSVATPNVPGQAVQSGPPIG